MKLNRHGRTGNTAGIVVAGALVLALAACGSDNPVETTPEATRTDTASESPSEEPTEAPTLSGELNGAGASAQGSAMDAWRAGFQTLYPDVTVNYDPVGSGGGRTQFLEGGVSFAGTDRALNAEEIASSVDRCNGAEAINLPLYISPIAVIFNLDGIDSLQLSAENIARIFNGDITTWNDPAIAEENPDVELPDLAITTVNRSDESGTTENFTEYLVAAAGDAWPYEASGDWPISGGQSGQGTSGMVQTVEAGTGTIGYADASRAGSLGTVHLRVGDSYVPYSPEAAAAVVDASPRDTERSDHDIVVELDRTTTAEGAYPLVLISYSVVCLAYEDADEGELVTSFLSYVASPEGQQAAADSAGSAPISEELRADVTAALAAIEVG